MQTALNLSKEDQALWVKDGPSRILPSLGLKGSLFGLPRNLHGDIITFFGSPMDPEGIYNCFLLPFFLNEKPPAGPFPGDGEGTGAMQTEFTGEGVAARLRIKVDRPG